ncbi:MAG: hypothetical protein KGR26_02790 [Cyanobacteria bacterium REEB65]|nr:hypothetical protein [Cyanobacteria bacterium REEB65]
MRKLAGKLSTDAISLSWSLLLGLSVGVIANPAPARAQSSPAPAGGHWVTEIFDRPVQVPVYGWVLVGTATSSQVIARSILPGGVGSGVGTAGNGLTLYSTGSQNSTGSQRGQISAGGARDLATSQKLSGSQEAKSIPKVAANAPSDSYDGTWYAKLKGGWWSVEVTAGGVTLQPLGSDRAVARHFPLSSVSFGSPAGDGGTIAYLSIHWPGHDWGPAEICRQLRQPDPSRSPDAPRRSHDESQERDK